MKARNKQLNVALSAEEQKAIRDSADEAGLELSAWCRVVLRTAAGMGSLGDSLKRAKRASPWELKE